MRLTLPVEAEEAVDHYLRYIGTRHIDILINLQIIRQTNANWVETKATSISHAGPATDTSFTLFPDLPLELRELIWSWAALILPIASPHIHHIAPDSGSGFSDRRRKYRSGSKAVRDPVLRILPERATANGACRNSGETALEERVQRDSANSSSLLRVCRDSRNAALRECILWESAKPGCFARGKNKSFLNKNDIYYFWGDQYWIIDMFKVDHSSVVKQAEDYIQFTAPALEKYLDQVKDLKHIAFNSSTWITLLSPDSSIQWLRYLPSLEDITILVDPLAETMNFPILGAPTTFLPIEAGTLQDETRRKIVWWSLKCLESFQLKNPEHIIPKIHVVKLDSSGGAHKYYYSSGLDHLLFYSAYPTFLPEGVW